MPSWPEHAWLLLLALSSQVAGWILISASLPRLPAALTSVLLTIQPLGSMLLGIAIFAEAPSALQVAGVAAILAGLVLVGRVRPAPDSRAIRQPLIRPRRRRHHPTPSGIEQQRPATAGSYGSS
jgi:drug/metabolite transporter (DMT)-like permease